MAPASTGSRTSTSLVGRDAELAILGRALAAIPHGEGSFVVLTGEAGIGKTRLAEEIARTGAVRGYRVAWGTGVEDGGAPPFWPWVQIVRACTDPSGASSAEARPPPVELVDLLPEAPGASDLDADVDQRLRFRLFEAVTTTLDGIARRTPLVLVVDDVQWLDASSLLLLEHLGRDVRGRRILLLGCLRAPDGPAGSVRSGHLSRWSRLAETVQLAGLDDASARLLIEHTAGAPVSERLAALVHERTSGNPLFVREVVRLLSAQGRLSAPSAGARTSAPMLPQTVLEVIGRRIARLSPACARLLTRASVVGTEVERGLLAAVVESPAAEVDALLDEAVHAGVLLLASPVGPRYRFSHPLLREVLYDDLPPSKRAALHAAVGRLLEEVAVDVDERTSALAHHFYVAASTCGPAKGLRYAVSAGRRAVELLAYDEAAEHFERALELDAQRGREAAERGELLLELADARMRAGAWPAAVDAYEQVAASARARSDAVQLARAALGLGTGLTGFEVRLEDPRQLPLLEEARRSLPKSSPLRAHVLSRLSVASTLHRRPAERAALSREAMALARAAGDPQALASALSSYCDAIAGADHTDERLELASEIVDLAHRSGNHETELLGRRFRVVALLERGELAALDAEVAAYARIAQVVRQPLFGWYVPLWRGMRAMTEGRLEDCEELIAEAAAVGAQAHSRNAELLTFMLSLWWRMERGDVEEACRMLEGIASDPDVGLNTALFLVRLRSDAGRHAEARSLLSSLAADGFARVVVDDTAAVNGLAWAAEAAVDLRDTEAAGLLYDRLEPYAGRFGVSGIAVGTCGSVAGPLGRLAHHLARWDAAEAHFRAALDHHRRAGATLLVAHTLRGYGAMLLDRAATREGRDGDDAERALDEAAATYRRLGLTWRLAQTQRMAPRGPADAAAAPARRSPAPAVATPNSVRWDGDVCTFVYDGTEAKVRDAKGLRDLARLLARPGQEVHVLDLVAAASPAGVARPASSDRLHEPGHAGEVIDAQARRSYQRRLAELEEEREEADRHGDGERAERAILERDALVAQLAAAYGLHGRSRRAGDPVERARSAVTWRVRAAIERLQRVHPPLGRHLAHAVRTGTYCCYEPEVPTAWVV